MEMETKETVIESRKSSKKGGLNAPITILILIAIAICIYVFVLGNPDNFTSPDRKEPKEGNFMGIIYMGGYIVPILIGFVLMVVVFTVDRLFALSKASGKGNMSKFVDNIRELVDRNKISEAMELCDQQQGSVGNVVKEGLTTYKALSHDTTMNKEQKLIELNKTLEEASTLEMPALEKNTAILSTIASVGTLVALMGTVIGMIKAFFALGSGGGAPDAAQLSKGIAEALINTALGIGSSALAIIAYNFITNKIDDIVFKIEEVGMSIQQSFGAHH